MNYIPQLSKSSCGMACLKMLLAIVHKNENYLYLNEDESHGQYSYLELSEISERYGVTLQGVKYDDKDDFRHFDKFPVILTVLGPNETYHALLVSKKKGNYLKVHDPAKGIYWQNIKKLISLWDGTLLVVNEIHNQSIFPNPNPINATDKKWSAISSLFQIITAGSVAVATFFIKPGSKLILPIIFIALSLISEISLRFILLKRMQRYDKYIRRFLPYVHRSEYYEFYSRAQDYKKSSLGLSVNFVFSLLIVVLIISVSLVNSLNFIIVILGALISAYLDIFSFAPLKKGIEKEVAQQENDLKANGDVSEVEMQVKSMEVKSYRYAYLEFAKKGVVGVLMIASSFSLCVAEKCLTISNVIFFLCLSIVLYQSLTPLFSYDQRIEENLLSKARINNMIHLDEIDSKIR